MNLRKIVQVQEVNENRIDRIWTCTKTNKEMHVIFQFHWKGGVIRSFFFFLN